jgi:hypothetical protein
MILSGVSMNISKRILMQMIVGVITAAYLRSAFGQETAASPSQSSSPEIKVTFPPIPILALSDFGVAPGSFEPTWESLSTYQVYDWYQTSQWRDKITNQISSFI